MLSRIKLAPVDIRNALLEVDDKTLSVDDLKAMERQLPTTEEIARLKDFEDIGKLAKADQYFFQVGFIYFLWPVLAIICPLDHGHPKDCRPSEMYDLQTEARTRRRRDTTGTRHSPQHIAGTQNVTEIQARPPGAFYVSDYSNDVDIL